MTVTLIAAVALNGAIGRDNALLWHLSGDMRFFRQTTTGHAVIMGRRTFESMGRALPQRTNIVVSRSNPSLPEGVLSASGLEEALEKAAGCNPDGEVFIIGGGQIYEQAMALADKLLITRVFLSPGDADTFFPPVDADEWDITSESEVYTDEKTGVQYRFETYQRPQ